jgi:hypothetical protein
VILEIYKSVGPKLKNSITGLRQAQQEHLETGFNEIDGVNPGQSKGEKSSMSPNKETIATNINPKGGIGGGGSGPGSKPSSS